MKAVILSAGQGKRLLPLTADCPKCILPVRGRSLIEWQIGELAKCGIDQVNVVLGFRADKVEKILGARYGLHRVKTIYNAAYAVSDNLVSCWAAHDEMGSDFVLLNGDTLFEAAVMQRLLDTPDRPVTVAVSHKSEYDADDMKVELDGCRLVKIGKDLLSDQVDGESIGMILFRGRGPRLFRMELETALQNPSAQKKWYLSVIDEMARSMPVWTCSMKGLNWCEIDYPADLKQAEKVVTACGACCGKAEAAERTCQTTEVTLR
jgi:L-glutamine-phosphate cytidylyltransferase